jgi:hypothetical protein
MTRIRWGTYLVDHRSNINHHVCGGAPVLRALVKRACERPSTKVRGIKARQHIENSLTAD